MGLIEIIGERRLYLDSNIFIYMLEEPSGYEASVGELAANIDDGVIEALTSELSLAETLVKPFREAPEYVSVYQRYITSRPHLEVVPVSRSILIEAARRRAHLKVRLPDAIHVATAVNAGCRIFLTNDAEIKSSPDLEVIQFSDLNARLIQEDG